MRWQWIITRILLRFILPITKGYNQGGSSQGYDSLWTKDFIDLLGAGMRGPQWAGLRSKLVTQITLNNEGQANVECPGWLLSVLEMLNCKNTSRYLEAKLLYIQFKEAYNSVPKVLDSLLQQNCSLMPDKYVNICQMFLGNKILHMDGLELISHLGKCYEDNKQKSNISLSYR